MILEVGLVHHVVYKTGRVLDTRCISGRIRTVKSQMEVEVREVLLDLGKVLKVERLDKTAGTVEEMNLLLGLERTDA